MDKMKFESANLTEKNIEKIAELFPNCITETVDENGKLKKAINFEMLQAMLSEDIAEGDEAYEFTWVGKKAAIAEANKPIRKTLRPCPEESVNWDTTENLYIEGDNLEVLKLLQESYLGKVKMIYIDPPYNTGHDFIYPDSFVMDNDEFDDGMGYFDEDGNVNFKKENSTTTGRYHSKWCSMIYSRLMLARNLLSDDGVIFISIDDCEANNLRKIGEEVFGSTNFVADLSVVNNLKGRNDKKFIARANDRLMMFVKSPSFSEHGLALDEDVVKEYCYEDERGKFRLLELRKRGGADTKEERPNMYYPFYVNEKTGEVSLQKDDYYTIESLPVKSNGVDGRWRWGKEKSSTFITTLFGKMVGNKYNIYEKDYLESNDGARRVRPKSVLSGSAYSSDVATKEYRALMKQIDFNNPKPIALIKDLIDYSTDPSEHTIILDFFSGSATTAHAVMQLNADDGGHRKFIMVQLDEKMDESSEAYKAGYKNICEIGKERIRRAGYNILKDVASGVGRIDGTGYGMGIDNVEEYERLTGETVLDRGFRVFKLDETNMTDVYYGVNEYDQTMLDDLESNIKPDRTALDLLFGCLLDWGLPLSMPYTFEEIEGYTIHTVQSGERPDLIACFDENIPESVIKTLAKRNPLRAVFRDSSFADSPSKINVFEIFKLYAPETRVKVI